MNWPDKLYLQREGGGTISGYWQTLPLNSNDAKYVLSEIVAAREIEIIRATLEASIVKIMNAHLRHERIGGQIHQYINRDKLLDDIDGINPETILKELGGV